MSKPVLSPSRRVFLSNTAVGLTAASLAELLRPTKSTMASTAGDLAAAGPLVRERMTVGRRSSLDRSPRSCASGARRRS